MLSRGGTLMRYFVKPDGDLTWSADDWATAETLEALWMARGVSEHDRRRYIPCAVLARKFPGSVGSRSPEGKGGLKYPDAILKRLEELAVE